MLRVARTTAIVFARNKGCKAMAPVFGARLDCHSSRLFSSPPRSPPTPEATTLHDLVFTTVAEVMQINELADRAQINLQSSLKLDLGMDVFKTYQLLDELEKKIESLDVPVEAVDKAQTLQDIVDLITPKY
ncbi:hypothetical protein BX616_003250 [Lobosporangium transversale]|uniref:Carrier domain-containing protein n=1 Tax=Lobosporangium transversale TaxID=64571 RepID=A0A1Y2GZL8_9FUNG|nr:hypothetical protein BCR41DRAFT_119040 [Lobosporangium transversale]KAF9919000.1 hypothetical protein BX616_003250 [Lobosporangium transversale]ORZ27716.1 hypothetical protein BCR41DRAFT_119040 [Lobosporangium transversale]|eukprot:XP_021885419.1 hypothetical protein BCR41DRAFT_119040 [Lobosporangium transversale]